MKKLICLVLAALLALSAVSAFAAEYTDKETVKKVQQALNDAGFDCGTPDGAAGKKTKAAIEGYQTANGLEVTGVIDDALLAAMGLAEEEAAESGEEAGEEGAEALTIPDGVEFWSKNEQNFVIFQPDQGEMTFCIDWVGKIQTIPYTFDDEGYHVENDNMAFAVNDDELTVDFWEYGTTRVFHRGTPEEYASAANLIDNADDVSWLYGEWHVRNSSDTVVINEDGTCVYAGTEYTWKAGGTYFGITLEQNGRAMFAIYKDASSGDIRRDNKNTGEFFTLSE